MQRIAVFLNGSRGQAVLESLRPAGHEVVAAIVPPGGEAVAAGTGIPLLAPESVNSAAFLVELAALRPRIAIVAGFSSIFSQDLIALPELGAINLHAGRLPNYRGGSPLNWQMIEGENPVGISVIGMDAGIDTGDVFAEADIKVGERDTIAHLHAQANALFPELVHKVLADFEAGRRRGRAQRAEDGCYWHQRSDADGRVAWPSWSAARVDRFVRALTHPYPGAWTETAGRRVRIHACEVPAFQLAGTPGRVCYVQKQGPFVVCADRAILITSYVFEDGADGRLRHGDILR